MKRAQSGIDLAAANQPDSPGDIGGAPLASRPASRRDRPPRNLPPEDNRPRRIYTPGRLLTEDTIDEIANEIVAALRRGREPDRR